MAYLQHSLDLFEFKCMEDVTTESLKKTFKKHVLTSHPDKGGSEEDFDMLLSAYVYLSEMTQRLSGGRTTLQNINAPDELKERRANQLINEIFDEFERDLKRDQDCKLGNKVEPIADDAFHTLFQKIHINDNAKGYNEWLSKNDTDSIVVDSDNKYGPIHIHPTLPLDASMLHSVFETTVLSHNPVNTTTLMLHPDEMAYYSGGMGVALIDENEGYTSEPGMNPEFCDLYSAFTSNNTVFDKVFDAVYQPKTLEELVQERDKVYECYKDEEMEAITEYEQRKMELDKKHKNNITNYFNGSVKTVADTVADTVTDKMTDTALNTIENGFCITLQK